MPCTSACAGYFLLFQDNQTIYNYVDIRIPTLERMYHKRLKGYSELGYQMKFGENDDAVGSVYDGYASMAPFSKDLSDAAKSIVIVSPYIQKDRVSNLLPIFRELLLSGAEIIIYVNAANSFAPKYQSDIRKAIAALTESGVTVVERQVLRQKYAVVDESIVWYGNVDFLAFGKRDSYTIRIENTEVYIVSNISLWEQYPNIQLEQPQSWNALIRRITDITHYTRNNGEVTFFGDDAVIKEDEEVAKYFLPEGR